ncbi:RpiR family transcriptional regulator [Thioclava atlantica]|uniref:RpiR family transcriptional regulator n=1 Tax=Thioclava atlantica TaxID=1317124 RepID=A0A085TX13_9RHOB|nr:RpiR family transcriptional regulator [Thioclava atlantica]
MEKGEVGVSEAGDATGDTGENDDPIDLRIMAVFPELTPSEKRLAEVVLEAQSSLSSYTASELAERAGISSATAARFFKRLGYRNYNEARLRSRRTRSWGSPLSELSGEGGAVAATGKLADHFAQDVENFNRSAEVLSEAALAEAVRLLARADRIWVLGYRNSRAVALYARALLLNLKPEVQLLPHEGVSLGEDVAGFAPGDVLLAIGLRRRPRVLGEVLAVAAEVGVPSILIGDPTVAQTARPASLVLRCHNRGHGIFDSTVVAMSLVNYLCSNLVEALGPEVRERLARIEDLHTRFDDLGPPPEGIEALANSAKSRK